MHVVTGWKKCFPLYRLTSRQQKHGLISSKKASRTRRTDTSTCRQFSRTWIKIGTAKCITTFINGNADLERSITFQWDLMII